MSNKPKICLVANTTWNLYNFRKDLIKQLQNHGFEVWAIAPEDEHLNKLLDYTPCHFRPLQKLNRKGTNPIKDLALWSEFQEIFHEIQPDLILNYTIKPNIYGGFAALSHRIPYLCTVTGLGYSFLKGGWLQMLVSQLYRFGMRRAHKVFFQNPEDLQLFLHKKIISSKQAAYVPGSGINLQHFQAHALPPFQGPLRVLFIGRMLYDKGVGELLEAAKLLELQIKNKQLELILVGQSDPDNPAALPESALIEAQNQGLITWLGPQSDVRPFIQAAHALLLPSYREGLPRVLLEGMAIGRPLLASDVAGCNSLVQHRKNGLLFPVQNAEALAHALLELLEQTPETLQTWGNFSRQWAENEFSSEAVFQIYLETIKQAIQAKY